ncbi:unnamed protein product [Phytomonas sp. EM1]|nr:unnamed protein product [Phytomonas sp. EM1]|eukprot:CCW62654.1 unnamed protein product [Phytomonas sp. isolate EM1]
MLGLVVFSFVWTAQEPVSLNRPPGGATTTTACPCVREALHSFARQGDVAHSKLAGPFVSSSAPLTGVHVRSDSAPSVFKELSFVRPCSVVIHLTKPIKDVEELKKVLQFPFSQSRCVVWVADVNLLSQVLNPLKELFEDNTLRGIRIVPSGKKGFLILVSEKSREELKEELPHRVVHMLNTVEL